jgi:quercetin dioxygenase-like cupin family protein
VGIASGWHTHPGEEVGYIVAGDIGPGTGHMLSTYIVEAGQPLASFTEEPHDR